MSDPFLWLEEIESPAALSFVAQQNQRTLSALTQSPCFVEDSRRLESILSAQDRIPVLQYEGEFVFNHWTDSVNKRGLWRRAIKKDFLDSNGCPNWETLLDLDALSAVEGESWVLGGFSFPSGSQKRALVRLSRGGKDASLLREFDTETRCFVDDGFTLPEGKHRLAWLDEETVLASIDHGPDSVTASGYPHSVRVWKRGEPWEQAPVVLRADDADMVAGGYSLHHGKDHAIILYQAVDFFHRRHFLLDAQGRRSLELPEDSDVVALFASSLIVFLRSSWRTFSENSLVAIPLDVSKPATQVIALESGSSFRRAFETRHALMVLTTENIVSHLWGFQEQDGRWERGEIALPPLCMANLAASDPQSGDFFLNVESFLQPRALIWMNSAGEFRTVRSAQEKFNANGLVVEQRSALSRDGTRVPFFFIHRRDIPLNGSTPTLLYGYGGFEVSLTPSYDPQVGACWLERGGAYAVANIRGGGEFGPAWHRAAQLENRQRAFDDFIAVAEELISSGATSSRRLAIRGGSNGGLLVGAVMTQRPDLFAAVICLVPLLDMMRYHKLLAGHSWMAEYGDPETETPAAREISRYSPYQKVSSEQSYPQVFFRTSTRDDRVHPGHARKMAAKMISQKHRVLFFENTEGGHAGAADFEQVARVMALEYSFLHHVLGLL